MGKSLVSCFFDSRCIFKILLIYLFPPSVAYDPEGRQKLSRSQNSTKLYSVYLFIIWIFKTFRPAGYTTVKCEHSYRTDSTDFLDCLNTDTSQHIRFLLFVFFSFPLFNLALCGRLSWFMSVFLRMSKQLLVSYRIASQQVVLLYSRLYNRL